MQFRDLQTQYQYLKPKIDAAIQEVLDASNFISGNQVKTLETKLAEYVGVEHCITCANGTDALQLALMVWGIGPGDAVFVADFTYFASAEVIAAVGAKPVFVDVDASTYNMDPLKLEQDIEKVLADGRYTPKAVIAVDLFGLPADYKKIRPICEKYHLLLLEDGAQGFGGAIGADKACSFGDIGTTSFFPAKPLGCYGDGGAIFTNNAEWAALIRSYAVHGKGSSKYDNVRIGMNSRLDTIQAAILLVKFDIFHRHELDEVNNAASQYLDLLFPAIEKGIVLPSAPKGIVSSWAQFTLRLGEGYNRSELQDALSEKGIPSMVYYPKPMHLQDAFSEKCICPDSCIEAIKICKDCLSLPIGPYITTEEISYVARSILDALK